MHFVSYIKSTLLITALASPTLTQAADDIKAQQVWDGLRAYMTSAGYEISSTEARAGNTIQVHDVLLSKVFGQNTDTREGLVRLSLASLTFSLNDDKTVGITLPEIVRMQIQVTSPESKSSELQIEYHHKIASMTVSGQSLNLLYTYAAEAAQFNLRKLIIKGLDLSNIGLTAAVDLKKIRASSNLAESANQQFSQILSLDTLSYLASMVMPNTTLNLSGTITDLNFSSETFSPMISDFQDASPLLTSTANFNTNWQYGYADLNFTSEEAEKSGQYTSKTSATTGSLDLSENQLSYTMASTEAGVFLGHDDLPYPISLELARLSTHVMMPLLADNVPKAYALSLNLSEVAISDRLWSVFDPNIILPRDPVSLAVDLSGSAKVLVNFFNPSTTNSLNTDAGMPVEVQDIALERFELSGVGTKVIGVGDFDFDNSDLLTIKGIPRPEGQLKVEIDGAYGLLDRLMEIGLIPKSEAVGLRMMLSMLTVPGSTEDLLTTRLEVTEEGHFIANGQRLR